MVASISVPYAVGRCLVDAFGNRAQGDFDAGHEAMHRDGAMTTVRRIAEYVLTAPA